jgi:type IV pilus assembly protein PilF
MLKALMCVLAILVLSACVSEPRDPSFIGGRAFDAEAAAKTRVSLGLTYLQNGNFSQAKFNLDKALEFAPRSGQAHYGMAFYYQQVDEPELAQESYEKALSFSNNDPDVVNSYGAFLCQQGKYEKAKEYFLKAVNNRNYISTAETYENLAICSQSQGKNQAAIEYFASALNHQPTRPQSLFMLASLYVEEEQWQEAKRTLFKYERSAQISAESLYLQFQIAQGLNDTKTAVGYGEILKSMFPEHANTKKYLAAMGKFKPAATVTRKIREKTESSNVSGLNVETLAQVLSASEDAVAVVQTDSDEPIIIIEDTTIVDTILEDTTAENTRLLGIARENAVLDDTMAKDTMAEDTATENTAAENTAVAEDKDTDEDKLSRIFALESAQEIETADTNAEELAEKVNRSDNQISDNAASAQLQSPAQAEADTASVGVETAAQLSDFHTVQPQENLYRISLKYNVKMKMLLDWNELQDASSIQTGTKLRVRAPNNNE